MKTKSYNIRKKNKFPSYFEYQKERLFPVAKTLIVLGVLYVMAFGVYDYFQISESDGFNLLMRTLITSSLLMMLAVYSCWGKERFFSLSVISLMVFSMLAFFILNLMVEEKTSALLPTAFYYLLASVALSPLMDKRHFVVGLLVGLVVQVVLILSFMHNQELLVLILPHVICWNLITLFVSIKLIDSAHEHYAIAMNAYNAQFYDELTGVFNRKGVFSWAREMQQWARDNNQVLSLLMIDLDCFKAINDTYGHAGGDEVIKGSAQLMQQHLPANSAIGRLGGEEYLIATCAQSGSVNDALAEKIRKAIESQVFQLAITNELQVTASIGVAHDNGREGFNSLLKHADDLMYQGKKEGRNCVVSETDRNYCNQWGFCGQASAFCKKI